MAKREKPLPPVYFMVGLILMFAVHFLFPYLRIIESPWRYLGAAPLIIGVALNLWADKLFKRYATEVKPFRDSSALVLEGPFRFSRNPMYLGGLFIYIGVGILLGSLLPFLVIPVMFALVTSHFIVPEEGDMERQFGDEYLVYKRKVRRWM